jgi:hypothetical protein
MTSGMGWRMTCSAGLLACGAYGATGTSVTADELFRWGEYDSLIRVLEPIIRGPDSDTLADSTDRARSRLYLGVAYFARGRMDRADTAFRSGCAMDAGLELDKFYVTPAISARFEAIKSEDGRRRLELDAVARTDRAAQAAAPALPARSPAAPPVLKEDRSWFWWGLGAAAFVAAGGGAYLYVYHSSGPRESVTRLDLRDDR